jgi:hypothetical protein
MYQSIRYRYGFGRFVAGTFWGWDVSGLECLRLGTFCIWDVLRLGTFCIWDVLRLGRFAVVGKVTVIKLLRYITSYFFK